MKNILNISMALLIAVIGLVACEKKLGPLPQYLPGTAVTLSASSTTIAPAVADSDKVALTLSWSSPNYSVDSSTVKYIVLIDSSGRNFSKAISTTVIGTRSASFTNKQINNILLSFGAAYNTAYNLDMKIISSYSNNNEQLNSNVVVINFKTYLIPPKVAIPSSGKLFLVGDATAGGWNNPVPVPTQQFSKLDNTTYQGTFYLIGGKQYLLLPVNGDWSQKYAVADGTLPGLSAGGDFAYYTNGGSNIPAPAATGLYVVRIDFQKGKFSVTPSTAGGIGVFGLLFVPGDYQGWDPSKAPSLASVKNDGSYEGYVNITTTGGFKFTSLPSWSGTNYGDGGGGSLSNNGSAGNLNVANAGYYYLTANTKTNVWSATATTWSIIGGFAASNWSTDIPMTYNASSNTWTGTITVTASDQFKFRANNDWTINLGDAGGSAIGTLSYGGNNIGDASKNVAITAGTHVITLNLSNAGYYTYSIQ